MAVKVLDADPESHKHLIVAAQNNTQHQSWLATIIVFTVAHIRGIATGFSFAFIFYSAVMLICANLPAALATAAAVGIIGYIATVSRYQDGIAKQVEQYLCSTTKTNPTHQYTSNLQWYKHIYNYAIYAISMLAALAEFGLVLYSCYSIFSGIIIALAASTSPWLLLGVPITIAAFFGIPSLVASLFVTAPAIREKLCYQDINSLIEKREDLLKQLKENDDKLKKTCGKQVVHHSWSDFNNTYLTQHQLNSVISPEEVNNVDSAPIQLRPH